LNSGPRIYKQKKGVRSTLLIFLIKPEVELVD